VRQSKAEILYVPRNCKQEPKADGIEAERALARAVNLGCAVLELSLGAVMVIGVRNPQYTPRIG